MENSCCETLSASPTVRTEHTPIDLTHTPLDFPLSGAQLHLSAWPHLPTPHATAAHGHTPNQHRFSDCSSCSKIHHKCGDRVSHFHHSSRRAVSPLGPVPTHHHFVTRTVRVSPQMKPKQPHCVRVFQGVANRQVTATIPYLLTRLGIASLSRTLMSRSLGHSFAFSSASCPTTSCREVLSDSRMQTQSPQLRPSE